MASPTAKPLVAVIATLPVVIDALFRNHLIAMAEHFDVVVMTSRERIDVLGDLPAGIEICPVYINRKLRPGFDLLCLLQVWYLLRQRDFKLVQSFMPKAGLIGMLAAWLALVPVRIHMFTGQVWATRTGLARTALKLIDKFIASLATGVLVDGPSQREFLIEQGVVSAAKSVVLLKGSISGVDTQRFQPNHELSRRTRTELQIAKSDIVVLFLGRLTLDKGVLDLATAFGSASARCGNLTLLIVGPEEDDMATRLRAMLSQDLNKVRFVPYTRCPEQYMAACDVFVLPSYREGFGSVIIEAAACQVPSIVSDIYGLRDAVADRVTGISFPCGDVDALADAIVLFASDAPMRTQLGRQARQRAVTQFESSLVTGALMEFYLTTNGLGATTPRRERP